MFSSISLLLLVMVSSCTWKLLLTRKQSMDCQAPSNLAWLLFLFFGGRLLALRKLWTSYSSVMPGVSTSLASPISHSSSAFLTNLTSAPTLLQHLAQVTLKFNQTHISASPRRGPNHFLDRRTSNHPQSTTRIPNDG